MSVSLIICTKNEAGGIKSIIDSAKPYADEIIVVDGHSTDDTVKIAESAGAKTFQDNGLGKGDAYKVGITKATGDVLVFIDADGSHDPAEIPVLAEPVKSGKADLVIGSRHRGGSDEWGGDVETWLRAMGSGFISLVINARWGSNLTDVLNGFRAASRESALKVRLRADDFDIEQHMIVQWLKHGYKVCDVRSHEYCRKWGKSKLPTFRKSYLFFWRLFLDLITGK